ncbi:putative transcriptional regulator [Flavobacterium sp. HSC-32F16]|uniref:ArsR/SmtB family transcription factor n=1 Tax=Flavobacterium sp. HSC-32F16 TaxID=2910964 RepID=UPI0020A447BD|nr:transcriptional regulator [Flavobacterium sp. HSC-32F16]MCP2028509.1 putative transcriptional regulator [Flavobacterium sp. HSC-32F16]
MNNEISEISTLIGNPMRSVILWTLLDNRAYTAIELSNVVETSAQNISIHLSKLVNAELLSVESQGRHKYYKIANQEVAAVIEGIANLIPKDKHRKIFSSDSNIKYCRTCYDHLAGKIGVEITEKLVSENYIKLENKTFAITPKGEIFFKDFGINLLELKKKRRAFAKPCLDWSERKHHLSGSLAAAFLNKMFELDWIRKTANSRAIMITSKGEKELKEKLSLDIRKVI